MANNNKPELLHTINDEIMKFEPSTININEQPKCHIGLNPFYLQMRVAVYNLGRINVKIRRKKLRDLLIEDFLQEDRELRQVDLAYINTQP